MSAEDDTWNTYTYLPLTRAELIDTATTGTPLSSSAPVTVQVTGRGGVPASGVIAVALDITSVDPQVSSAVTVAPWGEEEGITAHVTTPGHQTQTAAYVAPGTDGKVQLSTDGPATDLTVVVTGYFTERGPGASFVPTAAPARLLDTRTTAVLEAGASTTLDLPDDAPPGTTAAAVNVETTGAARPGALTITDPTAQQSVEVVYDTIAASTGLVAVVSDAGELVVTNTGASATHVTVDLQGYFVPKTEGGAFIPTPTTAYDSRTEATPVSPGGVLDVPIAGTGEVPYGDGVTAYAIAVTVISGDSAGDALVYPANEESSSTATVAFGPDDRRTNTAIISTMYAFVPFDVAIENRSADDIHVLVDVMGYFDAALPGYIPYEGEPMTLRAEEPVTSTVTLEATRDAQCKEAQSCYCTEEALPPEVTTPRSDPTGS